MDGNVKKFEQPGGLVISTKESGAQWDFPYEWAPIQLLADEGLRKYGFDEDADRLSEEFLSTVLENFERDGTIREKYNAVTRSSETKVSAGYHANVVGFGWTNGAFLVLEGEMGKRVEREIRRGKEGPQELMALPSHAQKRRVGHPQKLQTKDKSKRARGSLT